ncbi:extensin-like [Penaeus japonicus]|uniref:extensin-like n=1 Tax=Penaeus japonicus TaxID=27405 RepID=UPI001C714FB2|nr:extensin-like [Penaeus japonicus]
MRENGIARTISRDRKREIKVAIGRHPAGDDSKGRECSGGRIKRRTFSLAHTRRAHDNLPFPPILNAPTTSPTLNRAHDPAHTQSRPYTARQGPHTHTQRVHDLTHTQLTHDITHTHSRPRPHPHSIVPTIPPTHSAPTTSPTLNAPIKHHPHSTPPRRPHP